MNYCSGCHSLRYLRYNRLAMDLGLTTFTGEVDTDLLVNNLVFTQAKVQDPIEISMPPEDAREWFGRVPPDLSLSARARGASWLLTYLKGFYVDKTRPFGVNNVLVRDVAMPNVLAPLMGEWILPKHGSHSTTFSPSQLVLVQEGDMTEQQFDDAMHDLVTFLAYVSEPARLIRYRWGLGVVLFLSILAGLVYPLKKLYWRNVQKNK
jgi:ubiquinol-cytochrome c reductase cytochrome c1 subunit